MKKKENKDKYNKIQNLSFQTEVKQLLNLMVNSLYSNKEIFLRELISNSSDACDRLRFDAIDNQALFENDNKLHLRVSYNKKNNTITISDNGIGLSRDDAIKNLGTIAKSGTKDFFKKLSGDKKKDSKLIGKFGVGFYSSFIVSNKVTVYSRKAGYKEDDGIKWTSNGQGEFSIENIKKKRRGTDIELQLNSSNSEFLNSWKLRDMLRCYSDHISLPIYMIKEEWDEKKKEQVKKDNEWEIVNQASALWTRKKNNITNDQYEEFYKHITNDFEPPLAWTHNHVEGINEYTQLLFIPKRAPIDLWDRNSKKGIKLYVKRVFIMDDADQLLPSYLRFVRGVIDSSDLSLNISREILQKSRDISVIKEGLTKRVLSLLEKIAENKQEQYNKFWIEFGQVLKEGIGEDSNNLSRISKLIRFSSTYIDNKSQIVSFSQYVSRMKKEQKYIYYVSAENFNSAYNSPNIEIFREKEIEVLLLFDRVDEWMLSHLQKFEDIPLKSVSKGNINLDQFSNEKEKNKQNKIRDEYKSLVKRLEKSLEKNVKEVRITSRLVNSPSCIVTGENDLSPQLLRMLKSAGQKTPSVKPIMEINPKHPLIKKMNSLDDESLKDWADLILGQAILCEGGNLENPINFVKLLNKLLVK